MGKEIALFCTIHPATDEKRDHLLSLLRGAARDYYRRPEACCTTWSYIVPFSQQKSSPPTIAGLEIYTDKQALSDQVADKNFYQAFRNTVNNENLYAQPEELVAWYYSLGFVARGVSAPPFGGVLVSVSKMVCKDREKVLKRLSSFADWVRENEPGVLTYVAFTRPKAPKEVLLYARYKDSKALQGHSKAPQHLAVVDELGKLLENNLGTTTTLWHEVDDSFVSTVVGGGGQTASKL